MGLADDLQEDVRQLEAVAAEAPAGERAAVWTSELLTEELLICGRPQLRIRVTPDGHEGAVVARLGDVAPDGTISMVTQGVLNLAFRTDRAPTPLVPGATIEVTLDLRVIAHAFAPGHRLHLQLLGSAFPITWPLATAFTLTCSEDNSAVLMLPQIRRDATLSAGAARALSNPWLRHADGANTTHPSSLAGLHAEAYPTSSGELGAPDRGGVLPDAPDSVWDLVRGPGDRVTARFFGGGRSFGGPGVSLYADEGFTYSVSDAEASETSLQTSVAYELREGEHFVRAISEGEIRSDAHDFHYRCSLEVTLDGAPFYGTHWEESVPRDGR